MEALKNMKQALEQKVQAQINGNLDCVDAHELGEAVDMVKDLAQAIYYCTIVEAMEEKDEREESYPEDEMRMYYPMRYAPRKRMYHDHWDGYPYYGGPYYYTENPRHTGMGDTKRYHEDMIEAYRDVERAYPKEMRDYREGKSGMSRRYYVEAKEQHKDPATRSRELEHYMQELSEDITDMINEASIEEKQLLQQKLMKLSEKIK